MFFLPLAAAKLGLCLFPACIISLCSHQKKKIKILKHYSDSQARGLLASLKPTVYQRGFRFCCSKLNQIELWTKMGKVGKFAQRNIKWMLKKKCVFVCIVYKLDQIFCIIMYSSKNPWSNRNLIFM